MAAKKIHLVCNAHLDPVWLWEWEEGAAEALSTFRTAAGFCEDFPGFVFCHNEAILYQWVEEYEPALFRRIRSLVKKGKWHILGGWYLQPDCNMPSGESFVRQILLGKRYFLEKFGVDVRVGSNLDPFGHTRGLVQIMAKSGQKCYLFCRPAQADCPLPADDFIWVGYDGSEILACRASAHYNSFQGKVRAKIEEWIGAHPERELSMVLWGIGDHGGGASRKDLEDIAELMEAKAGYAIIHSTPAAYFEELAEKKVSLPRHTKDLNPWAVGCYTSMARVKQKHRLLENELFSAEKMASQAWAQGLMPYPEDEFKQAMKDLAFAEFHDILPGSAIPAGEEGAVRLLDHGLEILSRVKAGAFFALASGEPPAKQNEIPIFVYNPHPFPIEGIVDCEFEPHEPNFEKTFLRPRIFRNGTELPCQTEKEQSNLSIEWRKRIVFCGVLEPGKMNRFACRLETRPEKPAAELKVKDGIIDFETPDLHVRINAQTGLMDLVESKGRSCLEENAFLPLVIEDNADPWGMRVRSFRAVEGRFTLAPEDAGSNFSGISGAAVPSVRVIEDGDVRSVVEAVLSYKNSFVCLTYHLPKKGTEIELGCRTLWNEKDRMLKLSIPTRLRSPKYMGQVAYGTDELPSNGDEAVSQKWSAVVSDKDNTAFTVINDGIYGSDFSGGELRLSLLRSPAYSADPMEGKILPANDRFIQRQDQGERLFRFWINAGSLEERMPGIDREALVKNEKPYALSFFPPGTGKKVKPGIRLSDRVIQVAAVKKAEDGSDLIIRLFEPTGKPRSTVVHFPFAAVRTRINLKGFEIKTIRFNPKTKKFREVDLLENPIGKAP